MQVNKDFIIVVFVFFTIHAQLQIFSFHSFLFLANDVTQKEKKAGSIMAE